MLSTSCLSSCVSSSNSIATINSEGPIHFPKLPGEKIQSPEHYGHDGCMTGFFCPTFEPKKAITDYTKKTGKKPSLLHLRWKGGTSSIYYGFTKNKIVEMKECADLGVIPSLTYNLEGSTDIKALFDSTGVRIIKESAIKLRDCGKNYGGFFIRSMREMNSATYSWRKKPSQFKKIWRHVWNIFEDEGANEYATWVFNPTVSVHKWTCPPYHFFPGDKYVDWIGINAYNFYPLVDNVMYENLDSLIHSDYNSVIRRYPGKPIMICETGTHETKKKPSWVENAFSKTKNNYQGIKALCWWDDYWRLGGRYYNLWIDTKIDSSPESLMAFKQGISDPYFLGSVPRRS